MKTLFLVFFPTLLFISSCKEISPIEFSEALPKNSKNLDHFPKKYQGDYINEKEQIKLTIEEDFIYRGTYEFDIVTEEEILNTFDFEHAPVDTAFDFGEMWQIIINKEDELYKVHSAYWDTVFSFSGENIVRRYKGHLLLNEPNGENWSIKVLSLHKGELIFDDLIRVSQIDSLEEIMETDITKSKDGEMSTFTLNPSKRELKSIISINKKVNGKYLKIGRNDQIVYEGFTNRYIKKDRDSTVLRRFSKRYLTKNE
jgi:hypothetical protein